MNIIVVFEKIALSSINSDREVFCKKLCDAGKILNSTKKDDNINVQLVEGKLPTVTEKQKIAIFVSSDQLMVNMGKIIFEFSKQVITIFKEEGILLDNENLLVKVEPSHNIDQFISAIRKTNDQKNDINSKEDNEFDYEEKSKQYIPVEPLYSFDRVILPKDVLEKIEEAIGILECENKVFNEWGLYEIQPHPSTSLSFYGPSGTGKTRAAEAIAHKLGKKILKVSYADVESKYHGEGPKMVKAIFLAASKYDAVLFFDDADSLLSQRLTSVSQGSEQAINSMRSQLLICLEEFRGIVIFATNLVVNYDQAFLTRLISVEFKNPDADTRKRIWDVHIRPLDDGKEHKLRIPLAGDVDTKILAEKYEFAGREIRNAVVSACVSTALAKRNVVKQQDFIRACEKISEEKKALELAKDYTKNTDIIQRAIKEKMKEKGGKQNVSE